MLSLIHTLYNSLQHALSLFSLCVVTSHLVMGSITVASSASMLKLLLASDYLPTKFQTPDYHLGMDHIENNASSSFIIASHSCCTDRIENTSSQLVHRRMLLSHYLATWLLPKVFFYCE
jgi:hypothetical protein